MATVMAALLVLSHIVTSFATPLQASYELRVPLSPPSGASIEHQPYFSSFSIDPAFWIEFAGTAAQPNGLFLKLITRLTERGSQPIIRPGGITMDGLVFNPSGSDLVRTMGPKGEIYRTTVGPGYFQSWSNFPKGVTFVSTLNFANNSLDIAQNLALASAKYQGDKIRYFELGNEPNHYPKSRWNYETARYVSQWKEWTASIDRATGRGSLQWWASSATTDSTALNVRPVDIIPLGVDDKNQVGQFSIHSYVYNTCSPQNTAIATIENLLNHTQIVTFANAQVGPSARAALTHGKPWIMGEFNSVACSGKPNVTDTFTNALWIIDTQLTYAAMNASSVNLHQGGTLVLQSGSQTNTPGFSAYNVVFPRNSDKWGKARANPGYGGLLFLAEIFGKPSIRVSPLGAPTGVNPNRFSAYAIYEKGTLTKVIIVNMNPYYGTSGDDFSIQVKVPNPNQGSVPYVKRLTAPSVAEKDSAKVLWAGQSFNQGDAVGDLKTEQLLSDGTVKVRGSEAVMIFFDGQVFGL